MKYWTLAELRTKIEKELDLEEESFIQPDEMDNYIREAIDLAETDIQGLYEDYFLTRTDWLPIVNEIEMPDDIYSSKIRKFELQQGENYRFQIFKNRHLHNLDDSIYFTDVRYNVYNDLGRKPYLTIEGTHSADNYRLFYIRNARTPRLDGDLIDLPEFAIHYVGAFVRAKCYEKEKDPNTMQAKNELLSYRQSMLDVLNNIVDDGTEILEPDMSFYIDGDDLDY